MELEWDVSVMPPTLCVLIATGLPGPFPLMDSLSRCSSVVMSHIQHTVAAAPSITEKVLCPDRYGLTIRCAVLLLLQCFKRSFSYVESQSLPKGTFDLVYYIRSCIGRQSLAHIRFANLGKAYSEHQGEGSCPSQRPMEENKSVLGLCCLKGASGGFWQFARCV